MQQRGPARRLTTVLAADVVSYSSMTAGDEEHAVRLVRQRFATMSAFVEQHDGRVFNTAGDALLAEFPSPVEAVRCAIEIQEAMRTANQLAEEADRLQLRIGINLGDVMVSGSDLLGDGVNVAARLEGLAPAGGICVSSSVYDQLVGKLTLGAEDLGDQLVKNIPRPIRAYRLTPQGAPPAPAPAVRRSPFNTRVIVLGLAIVAILAAAAVVAIRLSGSPPVVVAAAVPAPASATVPVPVPASAPAPAPAPAVAAPPVQPPPPVRRTFTPEAMPFIDDGSQVRIRTTYLPAQRSKAIALSAFGHYGWTSQQANDTAASQLAIDNCTSSLKRSTPNPPTRAACALYALNDEVVTTMALPPVPPRPWVPANKPATPVKYEPSQTPLASDSARQYSAKEYLPAPSPKVIAMGHGGFLIHAWNRSSELAAMRAVLEMCGHMTQAPCFIYAVGDELAVRLPKLSRIVGVLVVDQLASVSQPDRRIIETTYLPDGDWRALAIGKNGRIGLARQLASEQEAINQALRSCVQADGVDCDLVAVGPFKVSLR